MAKKEYAHLVKPLLGGAAVQRAAAIGSQYMGRCPPEAPAGRVGAGLNQCQIS
jgi:hypothetical protein